MWANGEGERLEVGVRGTWVGENATVGVDGNGLPEQADKYTQTMMIKKNLRTAIFPLYRPEGEKKKDLVSDLSQVLQVGIEEADVRGGSFTDSHSG